MQASSLQLSQKLLTKKVSDEGTVKVGDFVEMIRRGDTCFQGVQLQTLVGIVPQHEAQQETGHHLTTRREKEEEKGAITPGISAKDLSLNLRRDCERERKRERKNRMRARGKKCCLLPDGTLNRREREKISFFANCNPSL